jgi:hypothetical protein
VNSPHPPPSTHVPSGDLVIGSEQIGERPLTAGLL